MKNQLPTINLRKELNIHTKLEHIWSSYYTNAETSISPLYQEELLKNAVTFLSINPSLPPIAYEKAKRGFSPEAPYPIIDWTKAKAEHPFFNKFHKLNENLKQPWTILDLLYIRDSDQSQLEKLFQNHTENKAVRNFYFAQIELTIKILNRLNPKIVVVSNAFADKLLHIYIKSNGIAQEIPMEANGWVYKIDGIPFITNESRYMGSRYLQYNKERMDNLTDEIERVLKNIY